ncbi:MAG: hypothetical protein BM556_06520 [Bacteriovorax sp. MedPE-SWde]|mgnify:FL=1|nr:MAG: hypothetical protein BM556_06520 [Bacteriovorax sp. MedPE-SWde]
MSNKQDFKDFLRTNKSSPSEDTSKNILNSIRREMIPNKGIVFTKLILVQAFIGAITMIFCPQFSMSLTSNDELYHFFHRTFGHYGCMMVCGSIFIGSGALFSSTILNWAEIRLLKESKLLSYFGLSGLFALSFLFVGAQVYLDVAIAWMIGATLSGSVFFQVSTILKKKIQLS